MLDYSMMRKIRDCNTWLAKMRTLALLAVLSLVASPAFAASCCCDEMGVVGHSHSAPSNSTSVHTHLSSEHSSDNSAQVSVGASCNHQLCEVSSLVSSDGQNKVAFAALVAVLPSRLSSLHLADARITPRIRLRADRSLAPDRWSSSGLSPPALSRS